jgi:hypothetical protein
MTDDHEHIPVLLAEPTPNGWRVWCAYCERYHQHGAGDGFRVAHCDRETPYVSSGYDLRLAGTTFTERRDHD